MSPAPDPDREAAKRQRLNSSERHMPRGTEASTSGGPSTEAELRWSAILEDQTAERDEKARAYYERSVARKQACRTEEALRDIEAAIELRSDDALFYAQRAQVLHALSRDRDSEALLGLIKARRLESWKEVREVRKWPMQAQKQAPSAALRAIERAERLYLPLAELPVEILRMIWAFVLCEPDKTPAQIFQVCPRWKEMALEYPSFWRDPTFLHWNAGLLRRLEMLAELSQNTLTHVKCYFPSSGYDLTSRSPKSAKRWLKIVRPSIPTITHVALEKGMSSRTEEYKFVIEAIAGWTKLRYLSLSVSGNSLGWDGPAEVLAAPKIVRLSFTNHAHGHPPPEFLRALLRETETLTLTIAVGQEELALEVVHLVAPHIKKLDLRAERRTIKLAWPTQRIDFPALEHLRIGLQVAPADLEPDERWAPSHMPCLQSLSARQDWAKRLDTPQLRRAYIHAGSPVEQDAPATAQLPVSVFRAWPKLEQLDFVVGGAYASPPPDCGPLLDAFLEVLSPRHFGEVLFPQLRNLRIRHRAPHEGDPTLVSPGMPLEDWTAPYNTPRFPSEMVLQLGATPPLGRALLEAEEQRRGLDPRQQGAGASSAGLNLGHCAALQRITVDNLRMEPDVVRALEDMLGVRFQWDRPQSEPCLKRQRSD